MPIVKIEEIDPSTAASGFQPHEYQRGNTEELDPADLADAETYKLTYEVGLCNTTVEQYNRNRNESRGHVELKLILADCIAELGHSKIERDPGPKHDEHSCGQPRTYDSRAFEMRRGTRRLDVGYHIDGVHLTGEAGRCPGDRLKPALEEASTATLLLLPYQNFTKEAEFITTDGGGIIDRYEFQAEIFVYINADRDIQRCLLGPDASHTNQAELAEKIA